MSRFDTVLWDVDQTLLDFKRSERYAIRYCFEKLGLPLADTTVALYSGINEGFWKRIETGEIAKKDALVGRFHTLFQKIGIEGVSPEAFQEEYAQALGSVYYYQEDSYELVRSLQGKYRQYLVTNGIARTQRNKLRLSGLDKLVDGIFVSEELGAPKPQKEFFDRCFSMIPGFSRENTIIVGDSLSSDIRGGNRAGIAACWYHPEEKPGEKPEAAGKDTAGKDAVPEVWIDYEIKKLRDILQIIA